MFESENKNLRRKKGVVPFRFLFGSLRGVGKHHYMPKPTSRSAKFLKVCQLLRGAPRCFFYDSACVSNLAQNKGNLIRYSTHTRKYHLTHRGHYYLKTREVKVDLATWVEKDSHNRYLPDNLHTEFHLFLGGHRWKDIAKILNKGICLNKKKQHSD